MSEHFYHPVYPHITISPLERWKTIPGFETYQVSNQGRVRSKDRYVVVSGCRRTPKGFKIFRKGSILKPWDLKHSKSHLQGLDAKCYKQVSLGSRFRQSVHVIVLQAFIGPCPEGMECRHLDGNPSNNRLENLCWGTRKENAGDRKRHGTFRVLRGEECQQKLKETDVLSIRKRYAALEATQNKLAEEYGVHQVTISEIVTRKIWKHI